MTASISLDNLLGSVPFSQAEWDQTPRAVQAHLVAQDTKLHTLEVQVQQLQQQVDQLRPVCSNGAKNWEVNIKS